MPQSAALPNRRAMRGERSCAVVATRERVGELVKIPTCGSNSDNLAKRRMFTYSSCPYFLNVHSIGGVPAISCSYLLPISARTPTRRN